MKRVDPRWVAHTDAEKVEISQKSYESRGGEELQHLRLVLHFSNENALGNILMGKKKKNRLSYKRKEALLIIFYVGKNTRATTVTQWHSDPVTMSSDLLSKLHVRTLSCGEFCKFWTLIWRIRSVPGKRVLPVRSSAIIHPTDQISTETHRSKTKTIQSRVKHLFYHET